MEKSKTIRSKVHPDISLTVMSGHFVTPSSHINYYIDVPNIKSRLSEASAVAKAMVEKYISNTIVDTIVCMDGCEVIGAYLAEQLTRAGIMSMNAHKTIYITTPETNAAGQIIFRESIQHMIKGKHVLLLLATATTGRTLAGSMNGIQYYGGNVVGVSAIFSAVSKVHDLPVHALFTKADIADYQTYSPDNCKLCKEGMPVDGLANGYGYSKLI